MTAKVVPATFVVKIPSFLLATDAWVGHRAKKPVVLPAGRAPARTNAPSTWRPFQEALAFYEQTYADPAAGVGFVLQKRFGVVFIDFDDCLDEEGALLPWAEPLLSSFRGRTFIERSMSGRGLHVLVLGTIPRACRKKFGDGMVEVYDTHRYLALTGDLFGEAPARVTPMQDEVDELLRQLGVAALENGTSSALDADEVGTAELKERLEEAESALDMLDPDMTHDEWVKVGMALQQGLGKLGLPLFIAWSKRGRKFKPGEPESRWASFKSGGGVTLGTLYYLAQQHGWKSPLDDPRREFEPVEPDEDPPLHEPAFPEGSLQEWVELGFQLFKPNPKHEVLTPCFHEANLHAFFARHQDWGTRLRYNVRAQYPERDGKLIDTHQSYRALAQSHAFLGWHKRAYGVRTVQATVQAVAEERCFDPVVDFLQALKWDGTPRLEQLCDTLGIESTEYTRRCMTRWLIGAVARALRPGCDMQNMLILIGEQGRRKSRLLRRLAVHAEWFHESHIDLTNKEGYVTLDRKWIVEFAELEGLRKADAERVKAFVSEAVSSYRAPYARSAEDHPRRYVMAGTANDDGILTDPSGARRFWIVHVTERLNTHVLTDDFLHQLWAEAVTMFKNGVRWWDEAEEVDEVNKQNESYYSASALEVIVKKIVDEEFAPHGALHVRQLVSRLMEMRVIQSHTRLNVLGSALRRAGWTLHPIRVEGEPQRFWFPPTVVSLDDKRKAAATVYKMWKSQGAQFDPLKLDDLA